MQNFRDFEVWSKAHAAALSICKATDLFPASERYGIAGQMRRAAASVPSNIAEGCGRSSNADLARELRMIDAAPHDTILADVQEVKRMLASLIARVKADN